MPRVDLDAVRGAVKISDVLRCFGFEPPQRGSRIKCPIHQGDNPQAFAVYDGDSKWHCHRCDLGGGIFDLAMQLGQLTFAQAVAKLAAWAGIVGSVEPPDTAAAQERDKQARRWWCLMNLRRGRLNALAANLCTADVAVTALSDKLREAWSDHDSERVQFFADEYQGAIERRDALEFEQVLLGEDYSPQQWAEVLLPIAQSIKQAAVAA